MSQVNVDVEICIFHIESCKPGSVREGRDKEGKCDHPELEFSYEPVE